MIDLIGQAVPLEISNPDLIRSVVTGFVALISTIAGGVAAVIRYLEKQRVKSDERFAELTKSFSSISDKFTDTVIKVNDSNHEVMGEIKDGLILAYKEGAERQEAKTQNLTDTINELRLELKK